MKGKGLLITNDFDLQFNIKKNGDGKIVSGLEVGDTLYQNQALILICQPGEIKDRPIVGVGIENVLLDNDYLGWRKRIRQQMELDGQEVKEVQFGPHKKLKIDANYR